MKHIINKRIDSFVSVYILAYLSNLEDMNIKIKDTSFSKEENKNINADRLLGIFCFSIVKKKTTYVSSLGKKGLAL